MAAEPGEFADGDVRDVDPFGVISQSGPGGTRGAVALECHLQGGAVAGALVNRIQDAGTEFGGEKPTQACLNRNVNVNAQISRQEELRRIQERLANAGQKQLAAVQ